MQLFYTHIQSLPILRTFHFTENQTGTLDSSSKQKEVLPTDPQKTNDLIAGENRANEWKKMPDPEKNTATSDQQKQLAEMWPGGTEYTEPTESMDTQIATGQSKILQSDKQVQAAMSSPSGDTIMKSAQKEFNANKDWQDAIKKLIAATPEEKAQFFEKNPELANFFMKFGNDTIKAQNTQDPNLKIISEQIDQSIAFNTKKQ